MHIGAYLFIIIVDVLSTVFPYDNLREQEIIQICNLTIYTFSNLILGLIVNQLATKILEIMVYSESLARSLMTATMNQSTRGYIKNTLEILPTSSTYDVAILGILFKRPTGPPIITI